VREDNKVAQAESTYTPTMAFNKWAKSPREAINMERKRVFDGGSSREIAVSRYSVGQIRFGPEGRAAIRVLIL